MGKIIKNGISYGSAGSSGGSDIQVLTQEEYDALVTAGTVDENIYYFIGDEDENGEAGDNIPASYIGYDNNTSGLTATDIQGAVDEVNGKVNEVNNDITELSNNFSNALEDIVNDIETIERYYVPSVDDAYDVAPSVQYILRTYFSDITSGFINLKFYMEYYKASTSTGYSGAIVDCLVSGGRASGIIKIRSSVDTYSFYCDVTSGGADAVVKKLGDQSPIKLGTARSYDLTSYDGWEKFTVDNFLCECLNSGSVKTQAHNESGTYTFHGGASFTPLTKSYNASTGVLTIGGGTLKASIYRNNVDQGMAGTTNLTVTTWLIP